MSVKDIKSIPEDSLADYSFQPPSRLKNIIDSFKRAEPKQDLDEQLESGEPVFQSGSPLKKNLKTRQLQMISIGGAIGTGLFVGSGLALSTGGPAALLIGWGIVSTFLYCTMQAMAELVAIFPISGSFATYAIRFIEPSWGFAIGWNYAIFWVIVLPLELVAASLTINYWGSTINPDVWVAIFYVVIIGLNLCGNKGFAEAEFIFAIIKIVSIIGFNILAIVLICGGAGKQNTFIGGKYWHNPGAFAHGFKGVVTVLITATYSLAGTELVGLTVAEAEGNPRIVLPKAIKQVFYRIVVFYLFTLTLVGFLVPYDSDELLSSLSTISASPFVIAIKNGGVHALPSIFNVVILIALLSIANASVYGFLRTIQSLGEQGLAPRICAYVDRQGRPLVGFAIQFIVGCLSFVAASPKEGVVFSWLMALSGLSTLFTWFLVCMAHVRFRMAMSHQGRSLTELPYKSITGFWGSVYSCILLFVVLCLQFWISLFPLHKKPDVEYFFQNYLGAVVVLVFYVGHKLYSWNLRIVIPVSELDIDTGRRDLDQEKLQQELAEERDIYSKLPWYLKVKEFFF